MDNADDAERQHLEKLLRTVRRRLRPLQEQAALFGPRTPPEVHIEIEDIQAEIVKLETALKAKDALLSPPPLTPFHHDRSVSQATPPGTKSAHAKESSRDAPQPQHLLFHSQRKSNDSPAPKSFSLHAQKRNLLPAFVWRAIRGMVKTRLGRLVSLVAVVLLVLLASVLVLMPKSTHLLTLYFGDPTGTVIVPVQRRVAVDDKQIVKTAISELVAGPRDGLYRLVQPNVQILEVRISDGTATINFDRRPTTEGDERGLNAIVLTLTNFPGIQRVQLQINGQDFGGPRSRPVLNPLNPQGLSYDFGLTEFLPLYFPSIDGEHDIRFTRLIPKTKQSAEATVRALLDGPGQYSYAVQRVIPEGTELRSISLKDHVIIVDFTHPFAEAQNRAAAVRTVAASLTALPTADGVQFLVEGRSLAEYWGEDYGKVFEQPVINPE